VDWVGGLASDRHPNYGEVPTASGSCACRFPKPKQLWGFLGIVPSEYSSGEQRKQGQITEAGSAHARRLLVEAVPK
jgi:transposase